MMPLVAILTLFAENVMRGSLIGMVVVITAAKSVMSRIQTFPVPGESV